MNQKAVVNPKDVAVPHTQIYLAGKYVDASDGKTADLISPVTGEKIAAVAVPGKKELDTAVEKARAAQLEWRRMGMWERAAVMHKVGELVAERRDVLAEVLTLEQGKPITESYADVDETATLFHLHAEDAVRLHGETMPSNDNNKRMWTFYQAVGTWGIVIPWNFPVLMFAEFAAPGLVTGNALVVKPPLHTPLTLLAMVEVFAEAGLPDGLVSILPGEGEFGAELVQHPGIDAIGFIGSSATAEKIVKTAGLKRAIIEASGNGPVIVLEDADVAAAAKAAVYGAYYNAGQVCCATGRVLVHKAVHKQFVEEVKRAAQEVKLGNPFDSSTNLGPMNNKATAAKVDEHLREARERGFDIVTGGGRSTDYPTDLYYEFTVVDNVARDSLLSVAETFGPVVPIIVGESDEDLLEMANSDALGLQGAVFTKDMSKAYYFVENMRNGQVIVNDTNGFWDINMPFGGVGGSRTGWGRIGGKHTLLDMSDLRTGVIHLD